MFLLCRFAFSIAKIMGVFRVTFLATELRVIGHAFCFFANKLAMSRGNSRVIPFVGVASVVNYDERVTWASKHTTSQK